MTPQHQTEAALQKAIMAALPALGCVVSVIRINSGSVAVRGGYISGATAGTPDLLVLMKQGCSVWLEVKLPGEQLRPAQQAWHDKHYAHDHAVATVRSVKEALSLVRRWEP